MFDVFYLDKPTGLFPHEQRAASVLDAQRKSKTEFCWIVDYLCDYTDFDFLWEPYVHQRHQAHAWPSQHQQNSGTMLVPKQYTEVNYNRNQVSRTKSAPRVHIKHIHGSQDLGDINVRYVDSYLGTMRRALTKVTSEYCWVTADICDYANFDFTWHPGEWQLEMLHVFASGNEKFGDTFYVHVSSFLAKTEKLATMCWYETLNFITDISVPRYPVPAVKYETDSVVPAVWTHEFKAPLVQFYKNAVLFEPTVSLWQESTKTVVPLNKGAENVLVPRECKNYLKTQLYDYPYIDKSIQDRCYSEPIDIIFMSNGEPNADANWEYLENRIMNLEENRLVRIDRVQGLL